MWKSINLILPIHRLKQGKKPLFSIEPKKIFKKNSIYICDFKKQQFSADKK